MVIDILSPVGGRCGGIENVIRAWTKNLPREFYVTFIDSEECCDKAEFYIKHDEKRKRIARNGQDKIIKMFTYDNQISKMMEILRKEIS